MRGGTEAPPRRARARGPRARHERCRCRCRGARLGARPLPGRRRRAGPRRRAARPAHAPPARGAHRDHGTDRGRPARRTRARRPAPRAAPRAASRRAGSRPASAGAGRCASPAATSACRRRPTGASATRGSPSRRAFRTVRGFVQHLEGGALGPLQARLGEDLQALAEGSATAVLTVASPSAVRALSDGDGAGPDRRHRRPGPARARPAADAPEPRPPGRRLSRDGLDARAGGGRRCCRSTPWPTRRCARRGRGRPSRSAGRSPRWSRRWHATAASSSWSTVAPRRWPRSPSVRHRPAIASSWRASPTPTTSEPASSR